MKKILILLLAFLPLFAFSQMNDVTKFLGIPVDGTKSEMIKKLQAKGFILRSYYDGDQYLAGEFNGREVKIHVVTNNNKVYRIVVVDEYDATETDIKIRFNTLCRQFEKNLKYEIADTSYIIPSDEDISFEMFVRNKRYQASFYQKTDSILFKQDRELFLQEIRNLDYYKQSEDSIKSNIELATGLTHSIAAINMKNVWFMIDENKGNYRIIMFYDNKYNEANGEDL